MKKIIRKMNIKLFNTKHARLLKQALDVYEKKHRAIAQNVANVNNPDYSRVNTDFSQVLKSASGQSKVKVSRDKHISSSRFMKGNVEAGKSKKGEKVDLTREMIELAENQINYEFVTRTLNRYYNGIISSITGRTR